MFIRLPRQTRRLWLISFMLFMLAGQQVALASPLHDHLQHSAECLLGYQPFSDDPSHQQLTLPVFSRPARFVPAETRDTLDSLSPAPYQGRAPPHASKL